jgi:isopentenyl-diphosphate delta-isomerase
MQEKVILVNEHDEAIGVMDKLEAHEKGFLHRAFSVFVFNQQGQLLLQQRALHKYHSAGLWTNTCCSHPRVGEGNEAAAHRRLKEEMGFDTDLTYLNALLYRAEFDNNLTEHEYDHLFTGQYNSEPNINPDEVAAYRWVNLAEVKSDLQKNPAKYTAWFKLALEKFF